MSIAATLPRPLRALGAAWLLCCGLAPAWAADLTIACGRDAQTTDLCRDAAAAWATRTGHRVLVLGTPPDDARRLARYQELLEVGAPELDVLEIDALWCGRLAPHLADLRPLLGGAESGFLTPLIRNDTAGGRLVALPWYLELGLLYYRSDLLARYQLPIPKTWAELAETALRLQEAQRLLGNPGFWGFVWAGGEDEALTATALEWIASQGGGTLVEPDGRVSVNNPRAQFALQRAADWVRGITPEAVLHATPPDNLAAFGAGQVAFMRHWSGAWTTLQGVATPVADRFAVAPLPQGEGGGARPPALAAGAALGPAATLGGGQLAVSRYSRHTPQAADLVLYLTGAAVQRQRAQAAGFNPTRADLYTDPDLLDARPHLSDLAGALPGLVARPSTPTGRQYPQVSAAFAAAVRAVLSGQQTPDAALSGLARRLNDLSRDGSAW